MLTKNLPISQNIYFTAHMMLAKAVAETKIKKTKQKTKSRKQKTKQNKIRSPLLGSAYW